ncbi:MAG: aminoacyl-tRNA hydrolase [Magnetococcales bacterium]|nr:aminoacyl-tRNA hydrolase [Magnetococcales bacterium]
MGPAVFLLVGLGNPGDRYRGHRHNLGWDAVVGIVRRCGLAEGRERFRGVFGDGQVEGRRLMWLLPTTFMNLSGEAVGEAVRFHKVEVGRVVVFHDDLDLELGRLKMKIGGGHGGHNGLRSIQQVLGTAEFVRVRLGIGRPPVGVDPARFVLQPFEPHERGLADEVLECLPGALPWILDHDFGRALNHCVRQRRPL